MDIEDVFLDAEVDPDTRHDLTYEQGYDEGKADCLFITVSYPGQHGYTQTAYCQIRNTYITAITSPAPTEWQRGYGEGFDTIAQPLLEEDETDL